MATATVTTATANDTRTAADTMSNTVSVKELRQRASSVLRRVNEGEVFEVTWHGHPVARIVPYTSSALEQLVLEGRAVPATQDLVELIGSLGMPIAPSPRGKRATAALEELRSDQR